MIKLANTEYAGKSLFEFNFMISISKNDTYSATSERYVSTFTLQDSFSIYILVEHLLSIWRNKILLPQSTPWDGVEAHILFKIVCTRLPLDEYMKVKN